MIVYNKKNFAAILFILINFICTATQAQEAPPEPQAKGGPLPPGLPIDDGLIFLFIAAVIFGVYITIKLSKKSTQA